MNDMRTTRKEASAVTTGNMGTENMAAKSGRLDERPRLNGSWSALRGVSVQIFTDGISYAAGIGQAPG